MTEREKIYQRPETVPVHAEVKDWEGEYASPTSITISVFDPTGDEIVEDADMDGAAGIYVYYFQPTDDSLLGWYRVRITVTDGTVGAKTTIALGGFTLQ